MLVSIGFVSYTVFQRLQPLSVMTIPSLEREECYRQSRGGTSGPVYVQTCNTIGAVVSLTIKTLCNSEIVQQLGRQLDWMWHRVGRRFALSLFTSVNFSILLSGY
jgi:hypothetical protein